MATILITGGTGMVGTRLTTMLLEKGHAVIVLTRKMPDALPHPNANISYRLWDVAAGTIDPEAIAAADHIVHLAGAGVADKRWTAKRKDEIVQSRVMSCDLIVTALNTIPNKVQSVVAASAIGWYGADNAKSLKQGFEEEALADSEFLGETCRLWETHIQPVLGLGKRLVQFRIGIVLSNKGGAFVEFKKPIKLGFAAILGEGNQNISWVHVNDLCNMFIMAIETNTMQGIYNAVAPETTTNKSLTLAMAKIMQGSFYLPIHVPAFLLKWVLGEMSVEVLKSAKVNSFKIQSAGFHFEYPTVDLALQQLLKK